MAKISILNALLPHLLCAMVQGQPSPCSEYFTYMTKPGITDMLGQIEIPPPSVHDEFYLKVALTTTTESPNEGVRLELSRSIQESVLAVSFGRSLLYHIYYPTHKPTPSLSAIWFNGQRYCPGAHASDNITATIELGHILYPPNKEQNRYYFERWRETSQPWHRNSSIYRINNPSYHRLNYESEFNNDCGITSYYTDDTNRLISDGEKILPGQWPWSVAIYKQNTENENVYEYACAGSLLTTRHVITVNFCLMKWNEKFKNLTFIESQRVYVSFGQFTSRQWHGTHKGITNRVISNYKFNDHLLILILKTAIEYNAFIKPVCLWSGSTHLQDIANMTGYVVGWGYDVNRNASFPGVLSRFWRNRYTGEPRTVKVPLISISERVGEGAQKVLIVPMSRWNINPCDNGGGFVVSNIHTGRYQLRGVASLCLLLGSEHFDIHYYDIVNHISWIQHQISNT